MADWHREASRELIDYARTNAWGAGNIYQLAERLTPQRAGQLPRIGRVIRTYAGGTLATA